MGVGFRVIPELMGHRQRRHLRVSNSRSRPVAACRDPELSVNYLNTLWPQRPGQQPLQRRHRRGVGNNAICLRWRAASRLGQASSEADDHSRNSVGAMAVTCRKSDENAAVLAKPDAADTQEIVFPLASRSIARTIRARCRHALKVSPVSAGNTRLALRTDVAAREANSLKRNLFW